MQSSVENAHGQNKLLQVLSRGKWRTWTWSGITKEAYQALMISPHHPKMLVYIIGCQRSGTTMLQQTFGKDLNSKNFRERGLSLENSLQLRPPHEIETIIARQRAPLIFVKPLVDTQNILKYLEYFPQSKAIWVYRNYKSVAKSSLIKWDYENAKKNLRAFVNAEGATHAWAAEGASEETVAVIRRHFDENMPANDAAACFWYARNKLFFEQGLDQHPRVTICQYEELTAKPKETLQRLYQFIGRPYPGDRIVQHIQPSSHGTQKEFKLNPEIEALCEDLLHQLDRAHLSAQ